MTALTNLVVESATEADAAAVAAIRLAAARALTTQYGTGTWSFSLGAEDAVCAELRSSTILIARASGVVLGTLRLATKNPWLGDIGFFSAVDRPIYLTSMAVAPKHQRRGIGRELIEEAKRVAIEELRGEALRLDSYDAPAGAGGFYRRCGFHEARRGLYHGTPLIWFEWLQPASPPTRGGKGEEI